MSMTEALRTEVLERKVVELESALGDADLEMEEVVGRMNMAQIEVMELQSARYVDAPGWTGAVADGDGTGVGAAGSAAGQRRSGVRHGCPEQAAPASLGRAAAGCRRR